jgi:hypothetical protein
MQGLHSSEFSQSVTQEQAPAASCLCLQTLAASVLAVRAAVRAPTPSPLEPYQHHYHVRNTQHGACAGTRKP